MLFHCLFRNLDGQETQADRRKKLHELCEEPGPSRTGMVNTLAGAAGATWESYLPGVFPHKSRPKSVYAERMHTKNSRLSSLYSHARRLRWRLVGRPKNHTNAWHRNFKGNTIVQPLRHHAGHDEGQTTMSYGNAGE